jgi:hypothetical protein
VLGQPTAGNSTATGTERIHVGGFGVDNGSYVFDPCHKPQMGLSDIIWARTSTMASTANAVDLAATLTFAEVGKVPA